jgi:hypothetical protein
MPNWNHIVREHLAALRLAPEREIGIVEEIVRRRRVIAGVFATIHRKR